MSAAAIMVNAANLAHRKQAANKTRDKDYLQQTHPNWMSHFAEKLPENEEDMGPKKIKETVFQRKKRLLSTSTDPYERSVLPKSPDGRTALIFVHLFAA